MQYIQTKKAPNAVGPYAQAIAIDTMIYTSGQIALDPITMELKNQSITEETQQIFKNLTAVLEASDSNLQSVVKTLVFLTDLNDFEEMNRAFEDAFKGHTPARSTVEVSKLPKGARVEIEVVALRTPKCM